MALLPQAAWALDTDWAGKNQVRTITPEVMDRVRSDLGLEHM